MSTAREDWVEIALATPETEAALTDTAEERVRQVAKWGVQTRPDGTMRNGQDDIDGAAYFKARTDAAAEDGTVTWRDILNEEVAEVYAETDPALIREELIQVAAVALSWVEDLDRKAVTVAALEHEVRADAHAAWLGKDRP